MAKLVINTQHWENYSDDIDTPYWKGKGGNVYVVEDITEANIERINMSGIPNLTALIECTSDNFVEQVIDYDFIDDGAINWECWESPIYLKYNRIFGQWHARRVTLNGEYGYMHSCIKSKTETWSLGTTGEDYRCSYSVHNYGTVPHNRINDVIKEITEAA